MCFIIVKIIKIQMFHYLLLSISTGLIGRYIAKEKGRNTTLGFLFGFFFNLLGVLVVAIIPSKIGFNQISQKKKKKLLLKKDTVRCALVRKSSTEEMQKAIF